MKNLLFISLLIFMACTTQENAEEQASTSEVSDTLVIKVEESEVPFRMALDSLVNLKYQYVVKDFREIPIDSASLILRVNSFIEFGEEQIDNVPVQNIERVQAAFIKGKKTVWGNTYPRCIIEEWTFTNSNELKQVIEYIEKYKNAPNIRSIVVTGKSPFSYFQNNNKIYLIETGGEYMRSEEEILKEALRKYLK